MRFLWLALFVLAVASAQAASFDCKKAQTHLEIAVCALPELSADDEKLAVAYKASLAGLSPETVHALRGDEAEWLRYVATVCEANAKQTRKELSKCILPYYQERLELLTQSAQTVAGTRIVMRSSLQAEPFGRGSHWNEYASDDNDGFGRKCLIWPQAESTEPEWKAWNAIVKQRVFTALDESLTAAGFIKLAEWNAGSIIAYSKASAVYAVPGRVSVDIASQYTVQPLYGMYYPAEKSESFHWLLAQQRELKVDDVFTPGSGWLKVVKACCESKVLGGDTNADNLHFEKAAQMPRYWDFSLEGLTIQFDLSSLNVDSDKSGLQQNLSALESNTTDMDSSQPMPVTVPWSALKPYLVQGFSLPQ